jgi:hypothetical protein
MRRLVITAVVAVFLTVPTVASAQGYPTVAQANAFTAKGNIHGQCGAGIWICNGPSSYYINCSPARGAHSRDCWLVEWYQHIYIPFERSQGCYSHDWVRLESNYTLTWHVDDGPHCS